MAVLLNESLKPGTVAGVAIQCSPTPGAKAACFLYVGERTAAGYELASPEAPDLVALYDWCRQAGWEAAPYNPLQPCGTYRKL